MLYVCGAISIIISCNFFQDLGLLNLDDFKYGGANITAFRLVNPHHPQVIEVTTDWILDDLQTGKSPLDNERGVRVSDSCDDVMHTFV